MDQARGGGRPTPLDRLASLRTALAVLLGGALFPVAGTIVPQRRSPDEYGALYGAAAGRAVTLLGIDDWYRSPLFLAFLALFALCVLACLLRRGGASKGLRRISFLLLHGGLLAVLGVGVVNTLTESVLTANVYVGDTRDTFLDGRTGAEVRLPFALRVLDAWAEYYPAAVRLGVRDEGGYPIGLVETRVGREAGLPGTDVRLLPVALDVEGGAITVRAASGGSETTLTIPFAEGAPNAARWDGLEVVLVAWRRNIRDVASRVTVIEGGKVVSEATLTTRRPLRYRGHVVHQRDLGRDRFGNPFSGYQVVRAPGRWLMWLACSVVLAGLAGTFLPRLGIGRRRDGE